MCKAYFILLKEITFISGKVIPYTIPFTLITIYSKINQFVVFVVYSAVFILYFLFLDVTNPKKKMEHSMYVRIVERF